MRALSGQQPWWYAITHLGKRIENRYETSSAHRALMTYREPFLLHASAGVGAQDDFDWACIAIENAIGVERFQTFRAEMLDVKYRGDCDAVFVNSALPLGGIVGRARCVGLITPEGKPFGFEGVDAVARLNPDMRWHIPGQWGHILDDVVTLPFVPCKGALGLWTVPAGVLSRVSQ
jgi:hypothetical protein